MTSFDRFIKRSFDIIFSLVGIFCFLPVLIIISALVFFSSSGSVFYKQERVGRNGRIFEIIKFRTMVVNADKMAGGSVTVMGDKRITFIGRFLRRWKLDELPSIWNVLKGNMSFVGPRPDVPGFADALHSDDRIILSLRPGITGPATLKYRDEEEILAKQENPEKYNLEVIFPDKVRLNREYVENYSFWKDIKYIFQSIFGH